MQKNKQNPQLKRNEMKSLFFSVLLAHLSLFCCPRTVEPGRQVLALHAVVLEAQVPQDDWLGTQEVVQRCRVQLLICGSTTKASVFSQRQTAETAAAARSFRRAFGKLDLHLDQVWATFLGISSNSFTTNTWIITSLVCFHPEELTEHYLHNHVRLTRVLCWFQ